MKPSLYLVIGIFLFSSHSGAVTPGSYLQDSLYKIPAAARASSVFNAMKPELSIDNNWNSSWVSDNPYPDRYFANAEQNILLNGNLQTTSSVSLQEATDGILGNFTPTIPLVSGEAKVWYNFPEPTSVFLVGVRLRGLTDQAVIIKLCDQHGECTEKSYLSSQNHSNVRFLFQAEGITSISLSSSSPFGIYDLAVVPQPIEEYVILDFDDMHPVKEIVTKHWAGWNAATSSALWLSEDGQSWEKVADLNPAQLEVEKTILPEHINAKFLKLSHTLVQENFKKASVFEIEAYAIALAEENDPVISDPVNVSPGDWDPDAGVYLPLSQVASAVSSSDFGQNDASKVLDSDFSSSWISNNPLPDLYVSNPNQNILLGKLVESSNGVGMAQATDGNLGNFSPTVQPVNGQAWARLSLSPTPIHGFSLRLGANFTEDVTASFRYQDQEVGKVTYPIGSSGHQRFVVDLPEVDEVLISSEASFTIQEMAAYSAPLQEYVTVDLGESKEVRWIRTRHWNGNNNSVSAALYAGETLENLSKIKDLDPTRLNYEDVVLDEPILARYVRVSHSLVDENFKKATVQEIMVFDEFGTYGPKPVAKPQIHSFEDLFGINTVWSWGSNRIPNLQGLDEGAQKFIRAGSQARNYHNIHWDTADPDITPDYSPDNYQIRYQWTQWHREYQDWIDKGFTVDVTYTFDRFVESEWNTPYESAFNLGEAFAKVYGPKNLGLVRTVEIGNEPWDYSDSTYVHILEGMAKGIKETDQGLVVLPAALQAVDPGLNNSGVSKNYMGHKLSQASAEHLDGINLHLYSYLYDDNGTRIAVHPEHPKSRMQEIYNGIRFRDANMPGKELHITEWGWDSPSANEDALNSESVSPISQAVYLVRGLLWLSRMGVDRAHWYFYANVPIEQGQPINYDRSGLTESRLFDFREKRSFAAAEAVKNLMGNLYFDHIIQEDEQAYVYGLRNQEGEFSHVIAWRPVAGEDTVHVSLSLPMDRTVLDSWEISGLNPFGEKLDLSFEGNDLLLPLSSKPLLVKLGDFTNVPFQVNTANLRYKEEEEHMVFELSTLEPLESLGMVLMKRGNTQSLLSSLQNLKWEKVDGLNWRAIAPDLIPGSYILTAELVTHNMESNEINLSIESRIKVFPNPVRNKATLIFTKPFDLPTKIVFLDIHGLVKESFIIPANVREYDLNLDKLNKGIHIIQVQNDHYMNKLRIIKNVE